jgi:hypothetical protein
VTRKVLLRALLALRGALQAQLGRSARDSVNRATWRVFSGVVARLSDWIAGEHRK